MTVGTEVVSALLAINSLFLGAICKVLLLIWRKVDCAKPKEDCEKEQHKCFTRFDSKIQELEKEDCEIWTVVNAHSHEGLPPGGGVVRR